MRKGIKDLVLGDRAKGLDNTRVILSVDSFLIDFHKNSYVANIKYIIPFKRGTNDLYKLIL